MYGWYIVVTNKNPVLKGICVGHPDATTIWSSHTALLPIPQLSLSDHCIHVLLVMEYRCLMSVGQFCDDGLVVNFDAKNVYL